MASDLTAGMADYLRVFCATYHRGTFNLVPSVQRYLPTFLSFSYPSAQNEITKSQIMMADSPMRARSLANVLSTLLAQQHPLSVQEIEDIQRELSTALTHPDRLLKLNEASNKIVESYKPSSTDDNTANILQVFLEFLSKHGQLALMLDIETIGRDDAKLKLLAKRLVDAILKPSK
ncbi:hypothetical protein CH063_06848 [Colletotrichum higginsianum]|uniref:Uncharacterized protein n=1 Tax=Colletotrichum higginsianum (strain IMI 349063) TaxID=759273 RepID=H1V3Z7_COLHI|nr:hypothetical protein CH063_06848 [Colletotrichum higginsianum]